MAVIISSNSGDTLFHTVRVRVTRPLRHWTSTYGSTEPNREPPPLMSVTEWMVTSTMPWGGGGRPPPGMSSTANLFGYSSMSATTLRTTLSMPVFRNGRRMRSMAVPRRTVRS